MVGTGGVGRKTGCGFFSKVGLLLVGAAMGAGGYYVIDNHLLGNGAEQTGPTKVTVETSDAPSVYGVFKAGADADLAGMQSAMSSDYDSNREGMKNVITACKGAVDMEKAYIKSLYAGMPVLQGSANPDSLSLEMRLFAGNKAAILKNTVTGQEELVTVSTVLGTVSHGLYALPSTPAGKGTEGAQPGKEVGKDQYAKNLDPAAVIENAYKNAVDKVTGYVRSLSN